MNPILANIAACLIMLLLLLLTFAIRAMRLRRAIFQVVRIFRKSYSQCPRSSNLDDLGLNHPDWMTRLTRPKDYKPYAVDALIQLGAVDVTDDGNVCLSEEKLREIGLAV